MLFFRDSNHITNDFKPRPPVLHRSMIGCFLPLSQDSDFNPFSGRTKLSGPRTRVERCRSRLVYPLIQGGKIAITCGSEI
jgi:hypothetical protein